MKNKIIKTRAKISEIEKRKRKKKKKRKKRKLPPLQLSKIKLGLYAMNFELSPVHVDPLRR